MSDEHKAAVDPARVTAGEWAALFYRQRVIDELSTAARNLEQREIDRLAEELVKRAHDHVPAGPEIPALPTEPAAPWTPATPTLPPSSDDARCHVCGGRFADMTHFVCTHPNCPSAVRFTAAGPTFTAAQS